LLEGAYDVIVCESNVFVDSQGSRLFFPVVENVLAQMHIQLVVENVLTQMHIQLAARRQFMI